MEEDADVFTQIFAFAPVGLQLPTSEQDVVVRGAERSSVTIAGAGSGKTETLLRILHCVSANMAKRKVIVTSFSNAAADAFGLRVAQAWPAVRNTTHNAWEIWKKQHLRTLHSFARNEVCRKLGETEVRRNRMVSSATDVLRQRGHETPTKVWANNLTLLVDEAQDCNTEQLELIDVLYRLGATIHLVGDPRQAIYAFQGAEPRGITEKALKWGNTNFLSTNFRSSPQIVDALNLLVQGPYSTDTQLEDMPSQRAHPQNIPGPLPIVYHCENMFEDGLKRSPLYDEIRQGIRDAATRSLAILVRRNADVDRIHQALFVAGFDTLARSSRARIGEEQAPLPADADVSTVVQVESYHVAKGQQFHRVWVMVQGYSSTEAREDAASSQDDSQRFEDLRLLYVAFSRAKTHLSIVILHAYPPRWLDEMIQNPAASQRLDIRAAPKNWKEQLRRPPPPADSRWSIGRLIHDRDAADGLLTHTKRGQKYTRHRGSGMEEETRHGTEQVGSLSDMQVDLQTDGVAKPAQQLALQGIATVYHNLVQLTAVGQFCGWDEHWARVKAALSNLSLIPLRTAMEGRQLQDLAEKTGRDDFLEGLVEHMATGLRTNAWNESRLYLAAAERSCGARDEVSFRLYREFNDLLLRPGHEGAYCLGAASDSTVAFVLKNLEAVLSTGALRTMPQESTKDAIQRGYALVFRDRISVVDAKSSIRTRIRLLDDALSSLRSIVRNGALGGNAILARLFSTNEDTARRPLPYFSSTNAVIHVDIDHCCLTPDTCAAIEKQGTQLKDLLRSYHTDADITHAVSMPPYEWTPSTFDSERNDDAVLTVIGWPHVFIPGSGGTVIDIHAKGELSVEDETHVLLCAALASASRAILWDTRRSRVFIYHIHADEPEELLCAALAGQLGEESVTSNGSPLLSDAPQGTCRPREDVADSEDLERSVTMRLGR